MNSTINLQDVLKSRFGFTAFRGHQEDIVRAILDSRDCFIVMPTGGGKSLCYQLPACLMPGACLVVSPLISLMKDQVDSACNKGVRAAFINSTQSPSAQAAVLDRLKKNELDLLYLAPERLALDGFIEPLKRTPICMIAVDEAHCMSEWGHDFRPDYLLLSQLIRRFPSVPIAAFTATATERVQQHIIAKLGLRTPLEIRDSFNRPNLFYRAIPKTDVQAQILEYIKRHPGESGIVYRTTRNSVEETAAVLSESGIPALPYHAGMEDDDRERNQNRFDQNEINVMVATVAFGMGIDKPNIRYVVHGDLPKNMESYYQETGRAGRDGKPSECILFHSPGDLSRIRFFIERMKEPAHRLDAHEKLEAMARFATTRTCRRTCILAYFGETYPHESCGQCDVCAGATNKINAPRNMQQTLFATARAKGKFGVRPAADSGELTILRLGESALITWNLHKAGLNIEAIALRRDLSPGTIACHLESLLLNGFEVNLDRCLDPPKRAHIESLGDRLNSAPLRELVVASGGTLNYGDLRIARAWQRGKNRERSALPFESVFE